MPNFKLMISAVETSRRKYAVMNWVNPIMDRLGIRLAVKKPMVSFVENLTCMTECFRLVVGIYFSFFHPSSFQDDY